MTRAYDTAATQRNSGGAVAGVTAGKNAIINGGFDFWQRGTSFTGTGGYYGPDRWLCYRQLAVGGGTFTRQTSGLTGIQYSMRSQRNSGNTATNDVYTSYSLESADSYRFAGQTVTLSFWAKAGANFSGSSSNAFGSIYSGTGTDQNLYNGYTGQTTVASGFRTLTTSWQRFTVTGTVASNATQIGILFGYTPTGTAGTDDWYEITGVQLEIGAVATPFSRAGGTIQGELGACQRYYFRQGGLQNYQQMGFGFASSASVVYINVPLPVELRVIPTAVEFSTLRLSDTQTTGAVASITLLSGQSSTTRPTVSATYTGSGATQYRPYQMEANNSTSGYLAFSAEL